MYHPVLRPAAVPLAALALCAALPAAAQQTGPTLSGSYGVAFTGESDPNARASLSLSLEAEMNGLYVGTENFVYRGSVLNEHDLYMGVRTALNPKLNLDLSLNHFHYPNDPGMSYSTLMLILDGQVSDALYANLEVNAYLEWGGYDAGLILSYTPPAVPNLSLGTEVTWYSVDRSHDLSLSAGYVLPSNDKISLSASNLWHTDPAAADSIEWEVAANYQMSERGSAKAYVTGGTLIPSYAGLEMSWALDFR